MNKHILSAALVAALAFPVAAQAQSNSGAAAGATTGAIGGAIVGGPVGAVVGGVGGAIVGGLTADQSTQVRQYVVRQNTPSVTVQEQVAVGNDLPGSVRLYEVPADVGVRTQYRYGVVNNRTVLVDPQTRRIVQVIE